MQPSWPGFRPDQIDRLHPRVSSAITTLDQPGMSKTLSVKACDRACPALSWWFGLGRRDVGVMGEPVEHGAVSREGDGQNRRQNEGILSPTKLPSASWGILADFLTEKAAK
jgi:hypothetical protein